MKICISDSHIFSVVTSGIDVFNLSSYTKVGRIVYSPSVSSVWSDSNYLYFGTAGSGILRSPLSSISGGVYNNLQTYKTYPDITNNYVLDIHGDSAYLCASTNSGVDEINLNTGNRYYTTVSNISRCFQTLSGIYYVISGTLNAVYNLTSDWITPDYSYDDSTHSALFNVDYMYDLYVKGDAIYLATNNGIIVIKEERGAERNSDYKRFKEI